MHSGRIPTECETSSKVTVGHRNKRRTYSHTRDITTSLSTLISATASLPGGKHRESGRHDIRENRRGPKRYTGDEGMGSWAEAIEGQGSHKTAGYSRSHGLAGSQHDRHNRHRAATYRVVQLDSLPSVRQAPRLSLVSPGPVTQFLFPIDLLLTECLLERIPTISLVPSPSLSLCTYCAPVS